MFGMTSYGAARCLAMNGFFLVGDCHTPLRCVRNDGFFIQPGVLILLGVWVFLPRHADA
jgi:hypothetical protein